MAVGSANHLPPWGGLDMLLSTNPLAVAVPAGEEPPIVLDMATTVAAYGKVKTKAQRGEQMPLGWMMDRLGKPLTDPKRANEGFLLPIGEYKGYGLALVIGLLSGTLNGAAMGRNVVDFNADQHGARRRRDLARGVRRRRGVQAQHRCARARSASLGATAGRGSHLAARRAKPRQAGGAFEERGAGSAGAAQELESARG